ELLPDLEQGNLHKKWDYNDYRNNVAGGRNATTAQVLQVLLCPSDPLPDTVRFVDPSAPQYAYAGGFYGLSSYGGNSGTRSVHPASKECIFFQDSSIRLADVTDGTSSTFLFGERSHRDPEFDRLALTVHPFFPLGFFGKWASVFYTAGG